MCINIGTQTISVIGIFDTGMKSSLIITTTLMCSILIIVLLWRYPVISFHFPLVGQSVYTVLSQVNNSPAIPITLRSVMAMML